MDELGVPQLDAVIIERELALYAHEVSPFGRGLLKCLIRPVIPEGEDAEKGFEKPIVYRYGDRRFRLVKWRCYVARVGGPPEAGNLPLTLGLLTDGGFADETAFGRWAMGANVFPVNQPPPHTVAVGTLERLP